MQTKNENGEIVKKKCVKNVTRTILLYFKNFFFHER